MRILRQIALILAICLVCEGISSLLPFPFPGSVLSMIVVLLMFLGRIVKPEQLKESSGFLLDHMMLAFLPAFVSIINYLELLRSVWFRFALVVFISTAVTFFVAWSVVSLVSILQNRLSDRREGEKNV